MRRSLDTGTPSPLYNVRWTDARDHVAIAALDQWWDEQAVRETSRRRDVWGFVAEDTSNWEVVGYIFVEVDGYEMKIIRFFVNDHCRPMAPVLFDAVRSRLHGGVRRKLTAKLTEWDTAGHLLLRDLGFKATGISQNRGGEAFYAFEYEGVCCG